VTTIRENRLWDWWESLSEEQRIGARAVGRGPTPNWMVITLARNGVILAAAYWPDTQRGPASFQVPADVTEFVDARS
jgi:hypothetical protein